MYFILYDEHMKPIPSVYQYLNFRMKESPLTSRSKAAFAIRLLYCFLSLSGYRVNRIDEKAFRELLFFLRGINTNPKQYSIDHHNSYLCSETLKIQQKNGLHCYSVKADKISLG